MGWIRLIGHLQGWVLDEKGLIIGLFWRGCFNIRFFGLGNCIV